MVVIKIFVHTDPKESGRAAAELIDSKLQAALKSKETVNLLLSTGASQLHMLDALLAMDIDFSRIAVYHLDEYIGLSAHHPASFRKYINDRVLSRASFKNAVLIDGEGDALETVARLNAMFEGLEIDVGVIGIGENTHIAFNDPPADFGIKDAFHIVSLDDACKRQQVGEGWFTGLDDVPDKAISVTCAQIMRCKCIISVVPYAVKAKAVNAALSAEQPIESIPASLLLKHPDYYLFLDRDSASLTSEPILSRYI